MEIKQNVPNAVGTLILGICSLVFSCVFVGLVCGIIGLIISGNGMKAYQANPELYNGYGMLQAGRIMSIVGIVLGGIYVIYSVLFVSLLGLGFGLLPFMCW